MANWIPREWTPRKVGVSAILLSKTLSHFTNRIRQRNKKYNVPKIEKTIDGVFRYFNDRNLIYVMIMYNICAVRMSDMQWKNHINPKTSFADAVAGYLSLNVVVLRRCCTAGFEPGQIKGKLCDSLGALHLLLLLFFNQHYLYFVFSQGPFCHLLKNWLIKGYNLCRI